MIAIICMNVGNFSDSSQSPPADTEQPKDSTYNPLSNNHTQTEYSQQTEKTTADATYKTDPIYKEGYDDGFEQGKSDGKIGYYDYTCNDRCKKSSKYHKGYEEGYEEGFTEGWADYEDAQEEVGEDEDEDIVDDW